jgi:hypothetical protein
VNLISRLAPISHKLATATAKASALTAFLSVGLLEILHEYDCGGLGSQALSESRLNRLAAP